MTERVYVHVGPHKTGTTYVQNMLLNNKDRLAEDGVLFAGGSVIAQIKAVRNLMGQPILPGLGARTDGHWQRLVQEIVGWQGPAAVLSHELVSTYKPPDIKRMLQELDAFEVHLIYTARDLSRVIPAMWQTGLRSRRSFTWTEYVEGIRDPDGTKAPWGNGFWYRQDAPAMLARWSPPVPAERVHVVTVPRPGSPPELLWQRLCSVIGVDPAGHDLEVQRANVSLGTAEAELLRRINDSMLRTGDDSQRMLFLIRRLSRDILEPAPEKLSFTLPYEDLGWVTERSCAIVEGLRNSDYEIVGDLDELLPAPREPGTGRRPDDAPESAVLDAGVEVAVALLRRLVKYESGRESLVPPDAGKSGAGAGWRGNGGNRLSRALRLRR